MYQKELLFYLRLASLLEGKQKKYMRIRINEFTLEAISEALEDYGFEGECIYNEGDAEGVFKVKGGSYRFKCIFESNEIELTELVIDIEGFIGGTLN
ncbi:MAG TPA: hypothetical protein DCS13_13890 [Candidatus Margulisbacteria bacterium]|nr:MAG: hypothetical protein A2X43_04000 [Candidatus Margulisbacteria bacterium GWD2_39_127]HAR64550.1 hypothetical protein [Candidatus Margulisiibacteriota bacterium]